MRHIRLFHGGAAGYFLLMPLALLNACGQPGAAPDRTAASETAIASAPSDAGATPIEATEPATGAPESAATDAPAAATTAVTQDVPAAARCYVDAVNAQHLDDLVGCFAPDGVVIDVSRRIAGAEAIRTWADREVIGGRLEVLAVDQQRPGHARLLVHWAPRGSQGWRAYYTFDEVEGRITQVDLQYA